MSLNIRRCLIPDLALAAAGATLCFALFLFDAPRKLFRDSDTGWHIRMGEQIVRSGALPDSDPYSFAKPGGKWIAWEWLADVLMGFAHLRAGPGGVVLLYLTLIAAVTWLWFRLTWAAGGDFLLACLFASPFLSTANIHWLARPHIFGWVLLSAWLLYLEKTARSAPAGSGRGVFSLGRRTAWTFAASFAGGALWANLHASFFLMPLVAALYATSTRCLAPALGATAGTLVNPYGWRLHEHVLHYLADRELLARIGEFQTFNFHSEGAPQIILTLALTGAGAVLAATRGRLHHAALLALFWVVALRSARGLPLLALLLPLANAAIAAELRPRLARAFRYSANLRKLELPFAGYLWIPLGMLAAWVVLASPAVRTRTGFPPDQFPVAAAARVPVGAKLLAPDKFGGYLIYRFEGRLKVFVDGRSDYYGVGFLNNYIDLLQLRPGFEKQLRDWRFTHALIPPRYSLAAVLPLLGWRETYRDSTAVLLEAPSP